MPSFFYENAYPKQQISGFKIGRPYHLRFKRVMDMTRGGHVTQSNNSGQLIEILTIELWGEHLEFILK